MSDLAQVRVGTRRVVSRTLPAVSFIENPPVWTKPSWPVASANLAGTVGAYKLHIFPFGLLDPWKSDSNGPIEERPTLLNTGQRLGNALARIREIDANAPIILTLYGAPWWMKSKLSLTGGVSTAMTAAEAYSDSGRVTIDRLDAWLTLVEECVELAASVGVRDFEVWNEAKGFYSVPSGKGQTWDARYAAGTPGNADMGYSYFYEATANHVVQTMTAMGFDRHEYRVGGPYPVLSTRGDLSADAVPEDHPLRQFAPVWGYANKAPVNFVREFLGHVRERNMPMDVLTLDAGTGLTKGEHPTADPFDLTRKVADLTRYFRGELDEFGFDPDLPIDFTELYPSPQPALQTPDAGQLRAALWADALTHAVLNRVRYVAMWGPTSPAGGAYSETGGLVDSAGERLPAGETFAAFTRHFGPGVEVAAIEGDDRVGGVGSEKIALLYNKTAEPLPVHFEGVDGTLPGHGQVMRLRRSEPPVVVVPVEPEPVEPVEPTPAPVEPIRGPVPQATVTHITITIRVEVADGGAQVRVTVV